MLAIRAPFSALGGASLSVALFLGLAHLVSVPFAVESPPTTEPRVLARPRFVSPPPPTRRQKIEREPRQLMPDVPGVSDDDNVVRIDRVRYTRPPALETRPDNRDSLGLRGFDGDVVPVAKPPPEYPARAIIGNIEGWVKVRFTVTAIGTVRDAVVVDSEPDAVFDDAALKSIARWRYRPRVENGEAVERMGLQTIVRFTLED